jgi:hypothetical protein
MLRQADGAQEQCGGCGSRCAELRAELRMPYQRVEAFRVRMDVEYQGPKQLKLP